MFKTLSNKSFASLLDIFIMISCGQCHHVLISRLWIVCGDEHHRTYRSSEKEAML